MLQIVKTPNFSPTVKLKENNENKCDDENVVVENGMKKNKKLRSKNIKKGDNVDNINFDDFYDGEFDNDELNVTDQSSTDVTISNPQTIISTHFW
jgi:ribosome biogenesis GTPase A